MPELQLVGTSAFAYQGTNAHILLRKEALSSGDAGAQLAGKLAGSAGGMPWQHQRLWLMPQLSLLAQQAYCHRGNSSKVTFEVDLSHAALSMLWDHQVAGQVLLPGAAMLEAAAASALAAASPAFSTAWHIHYRERGPYREVSAQHGTYTT
jgi:acyl transferase domain-containing protein